MFQAAVIKTQWLADRLGGRMFSVVFKHEYGTQTQTETSTGTGTENL